jgi:hypothetical protein
VDILIAIITLALLAIVIFVISAPLRAAWRPLSTGSGSGSADDRVELEAAREAKYREIRDTELDYRTGKLSREDFAATDGALRAEALEILDRIQQLESEDARTRDA